MKLSLIKTEEGHILELVRISKDAFESDVLVGAAIGDVPPQYDPAEFKKGYGMAIMKEIESMYSNVSAFHLDTPEWNVRTNRFYKKLGYKELKKEEGFVFYQK